MGQVDLNTESSTLVKQLATVRDPRGRQGQRYEWVFVLTVIAAAMMSGENTLTGISQWVKYHTRELIAQLQPRRGCVPSYATLRRALQGVAIEELEGAIGAYLQGLRPALGEGGEVVTETGERLRGQAVDGKTVRCASAHQAGRLTHLVAVVGHEHGVVWAQANAESKLGEGAVAQRLLANQSLTGTVTTFDALHTGVKQANQIRRQGEHYLFVVKRNQQQLYQDIAQAFTALPPQGACEVDFWRYAQWQERVRGHGRTVDYCLESTPALNDFLTFPDVAQVVRRTRCALNHRTGRRSVQVEFLITSLPRQLISLAQLARFRRWHWTIENVTHYPRDVSFGEDRCPVHLGSAPQALAAFRNAVAGTLKVEGWPYLPNAFRFCRHNLQISLQWIGALTS